MTELERRLMSAIGLCMKAGKLASGEFAAEKALKSGGKLAIVDENASENTKKQWRDACMFRGVPIIFVRDLGFAIGKSARMSAVVTDDGFKKMILSAEQKLSAERGGLNDAEENANQTETEKTDNCEKQNVHHTEAETYD